MAALNRSPFASWSAPPAIATNVHSTSLRSTPFANGADRKQLTYTFVSAPGWWWAGDVRCGDEPVWWWAGVGGGSGARASLPAQLESLRAVRELIDRAGGKHAAAQAVARAR